MKLFWGALLLGSILLLAVVINGKPDTIRMQKIVKANHRVVVNVLDCSEAHIGKTHVYTLWFKYASKVQSLRVGKEYWTDCCSKKKAELLHLTSYSDLFLQPGYRVNNEFYSQITLIAMMSMCAIYSVMQIFSNKPAFDK
ncbi:hypothetical protein [Hymenobacter sp. CRA2]|uniref:hypothetical protein n=1 Tax=Hymenobacter sp. CRA2 TaxID=1955620 RepID=UPI0011169023|nr:hypothetical protein [Hymenobacter sp. CRA2]